MFNIIINIMLSKPICYMLHCHLYALGIYYIDTNNIPNTMIMFIGYCFNKKLSVL